MVSDNAQDVFSQPSDNLQSFVVFSQSFNEHERGITSVVSEFFSLSNDFGFSVVDPDQVLLSGLDFRLQPFSVFGGFVSDSFVLIGDGSQLSDLSAQSFFLGSVDFVSSFLSIDVGLFEGVQQIQSGVDGVTGTGLHVHQRVQLGLELGLFRNCGTSYKSYD